MLMIIAICMTSVKALRVDSIYVLHFTAGSSIFAYIWLFLIVSVISPGEIEVWEAVVTILYFPLFVFVAWLFDTGRLATGAEYIAHAMPLQRKAKRLAKTASQHLDSQLEMDEHSHLTQVAEIRVLWRRKRRLKKLIAEIKRREPNQEEGEVIQRAITELTRRHPVTAGRSDSQPTTIKGQFGFTEAKRKWKDRSQLRMALKIQRLELPTDPTLAGECYIRIVPNNGTAEEGVHFRLPEENRFHFPAGEKQERIVTIDVLPTDVYQGRRAFDLTLEVEGHHHCHWKNRTCRIEIKDHLRSKTWLGRVFEK